MTYLKNSYTFAVFFFSCIILLSGCKENSPYNSILFEKRNSIPGDGRSSAVAYVINGKGYVCLGRNSAGVQLNDCWEYNPTSDQWTKKASFPGIPRVKATATVLKDKAYVGMGHNDNTGVYNTSSCLKDFWAYNPETDIWTRLADYPSNYTDACVSYVYNNNIYVGGGFSESSYGNEFWKYLPDEDKWIRLTDFPGKARFGSVACNNNQHIYYGTGYRVGNLKDWWEYYPESDTWKKRKDMPGSGRVNATSLCIANRVYVATGRHFGGNLTGGHLMSDICEFDVASDCWYKRGDIPDGNRENAISFVIDGKGYIGFGENDKSVLNDFWSFNP